MIFRIDKEHKEVDFSIAVHKTEENIFYTHDEAPELLNIETFNLLVRALEFFNEDEYRFVGFIDEEDVLIIYRCYKRNERVWENVIFDELVDILKTCEYEHKIMNCLMYE